MNGMRITGAVVLGTLATAALAGHARAGVNLVQNGDFENTNFSGSQELVGGNVATGWSSSGYNFLFQSGSADTTGAAGTYGNVQLWGPNNGSANGLPAGSPAGGNYIGADGAFQVGAITQTLNGLVAGKKYNVSFYWGGAQQSGFTGPTTEQWVVGLGGESQSTAVLDNASHGFTGWRKQTFTYTATGSSEVLSFLAVGTPAGVPPFSVLDGVSATAAGVPEPATWGVMLLGVTAIAGAAVARHRRGTGAGRTV